MILYLIRHGQSANNSLVDLTQRVCDPDLTELGRQQAELVAKHLASGRERFPRNSAETCHEGYVIDRLYCSPMWRALLTAQPIGKALDLTPEVWTEVHELGGIYLDYGEAGGIVGYPGKSRQEIRAEFPGYVLPESVSQCGWWREEQGFEDLAAFRRRAISVAEEFRRLAKSEERIAIVSHGDFIDALIKALLNRLPDQTTYHYQSNTSISRIDFQHSGRLEIRYLNRVDHLPIEMIS